MIRVDTAAFQNSIALSLSLSAPAFKETMKEIFVPRWGRRRMDGWVICHGSMVHAQAEIPPPDTPQPCSTYMYLHFTPFVRRHLVKFFTATAGCCLAATASVNSPQRQGASSRNRAHSLMCGPIQRFVRLHSLSSSILYVANAGRARRLVVFAMDVSLYSLADSRQSKSSRPACT